MVAQRRRTGRARAVMLLAVVLALFAAACGGGTEAASVAVEDVDGAGEEPAPKIDEAPQNEADNGAANDGAPPAAGLPGDLVGALVRTVSAPAAFNLTLELDDVARSGLETADPQAASILDGMRLTGAVSEESGRFTFHMLDTDVFEMRKLDAASAYMRLDLEPFARLAGEPLPVDEMLASVEGLPASYGAMMKALLSGQWVGFVGDPQTAQETWGGAYPFDRGAVAEDARRAFGASPAEVANRFLEAEPRGEPADGAQTYDVRLRLRALADASARFFSGTFGQASGLEVIPDAELEAFLAEVPPIVGGMQIVVRDGVVVRLAADLLEIARDAGAPDVPEGSMTLALTLSDHGQQPDVTAPDGAHVIDLEALAAELQGAGPPVFPPPGDAGPDNSGPNAPGPTGPRPTDPDVAGSAAASGDVPAILKQLAGAQYAVASETGAFSRDTQELLLYAGVEPPPGTPLGACVTADGDGFVVAMLVRGAPLYLPSAASTPTSDTSTLGCLPAIEPVGGSYG